MSPQIQLIPQATTDNDGRL